jgi:predicted DCC family thiol-disulfide oxidoreductase YuxK
MAWIGHIPAIRALFSIDTRSLAAFRIGLGVLLLVDLVLRSQNLVAHYTDDGVMPRLALLGGFVHEAALSLHLVSGSAWWQALLMLLAGVFAIGLTIGWRTRLCTVVSWLLLLSLHSRNPAILNGGDGLLRLLVFWGMFLPLGAAYSVDAALNTSDDPPPRRILSMGGAALLLQIAFMYIFTAILKTGYPWKDGTAIYYAMQLDAFRTVAGDLLVPQHGLMEWMTHATIWFERVAPLLIFFPFFVRQIRTALVFAFVFFHVGLAITMHIGLFPYICIAAWLAFLPSAFWDGLDRRLRPQGAPRIFFDGDCSFCRRMVNLVRTFLVLPDVRATPAQDDPNIEAVMQRDDSWVVVRADGRRETRFDAAIALCEVSPIGRFGAPMLKLPPVRQLGTWLYQVVSNHRDITSRLIAQPRPMRWRAGMCTQLIAFAVIAYVLLWNISTVAGSVHQPRHFRGLAEMVRVTQKWSMFAPKPMLTDSWLVTEAVLADGSRVDLQTGKPVTFAKPADAWRWTGGTRWRKFTAKMHRSSMIKRRDLYVDYLVRSWNAQCAPEREVESVTLWSMVERTRWGYKPPIARKVQLLVWPESTTVAGAESDR